jgi:aspartyl-tRNA(Asn)/glutamyl-tRNA(Gln) amidotransferase subunit B
MAPPPSAGGRVMSASDFEAVIGLEVHAEMLTQSKIFCGCAATFGAPPNHHTCPVCLGMPGVLPALNRRVVEFAIRAGLATHCTIAPTSRWARKNYFYPDLAKGYQISQYELPICLGGHVDLVVDGTPKRVRLTRIHMEEDTGKNIHDAHGRESLVDFNRSGVPLLEIVSEPDMSSPAEAGAYLRALRALVVYLGICDGNMEEGSFRCDANVSVRTRGAKALGVKAEVKNMNSFRAVEKAIAFEIDRHIRTIEDGGTIVQETRLWDADREETRSMRSKESAHDYRYFPDPDLPPILVSQALIDEVRRTMPELPDARRARFVEKLKLPEYDAEVLTSRRDVADYFEAVVAAQPNAKAASNWVMGDVLRLVKERKLDEALVITEWPVPAAHLGELIALIDSGAISGKIAKTVFEEMVAGGGAPRAIVESRGLLQVSDEGPILAAIEQVLAAHPDKVADFRAGKDKLLGFFVGQVMKATEGKANPPLVNRLLTAKLRGES